MKSDRQLREIDIQDKVAQAYQDARYRKPHSRRYHIWWVEDMLSATSDAGLWLDLGCGTGWISEVLQIKHQRRRLVGVDISAEMLRFAQIKKCPVLRGDAETLLFRQETFDGVLAKGVLHHLPDIETLLGEIARILKPGGIAVFADPNLSPLRILKYSLSHRREHFSELHRAMRPRDYVRKFMAHFKIVEFKFFGMFAYPAAFPDILPFEVSEKRMAHLIRLDQLIAKVPIIKELCWAFKLTAIKCASEK